FLRAPLHSELRERFTDDGRQRKRAVWRRWLRDERSHIRERSLTGKSVAAQMAHIRAELNPQLLHRIAVAMLEMPESRDHPAARNLSRQRLPTLYIRL